MFDHVSITVSDIAAAERFYDAIMKALGVVKVGRRDDWLVMANAPAPPIRTVSISPSARGRSRKRHSVATGASRRDGRPRSMHSGTPALRRVAPTTGRRARATITRPTMVRSCATPTATASRRCATRSRARTHRHVGLPPILLQKSFWGRERKFLEPLMRFARGDVRGHIASSKIDHGPP